MARRPRQAADEAAENKTATEVETETEVNAGTEAEAETEAEKPQSDGNIIYPIVFAVRLHNHHPHDSYGRIGRRFNKQKEVEVPFNELSNDEIATLVSDPWLDVVPITED